MSRSSSRRAAGTLASAPPQTGAGTSLEAELLEPWARRFAIVLVLALLPQAIVAYALASWVSRDGFVYGTFAARLGACLAGLVLLRLSPEELGLGSPKLTRRDLAIGTALVAVGTAVALGLLGLDSYRAAYAHVLVGDPRERFVRWALFTLSTTLSWEWLHRGLLLFGIRTVLRGEPRVRPAASVVAIAVTAVFEVLFHFRKPPLEAGAMLIGSPLLSWIALRQESLWIPLLLHVWLEALFFLMVWT